MQQQPTSTSATSTTDPSTGAVVAPTSGTAATTGRKIILHHPMCLKGCVIVESLHRSLQSIIYHTRLNLGKQKTNINSHSSNKTYWWWFHFLAGQAQTMADYQAKLAEYYKSFGQQSQPQQQQPPQ